MLKYSVSGSLVGYMATDAKCTLTVFEICILTILTKLSVLPVTCNHLDAGYNGNHPAFNDELCALFSDAYEDVYGSNHDNCCDGN